MSAPCPHGKRRRQCKECGGKGICQHNRRRSSCKDCGGSSICQHGRQKRSCKSCETLRTLATSVYQHLDDYAVAYGCLESEVMQQISCNVKGNFLFKNVYDIDASRHPIPYAVPLHSNRCLNHNAVVFLTRLLAPFNQLAQSFSPRR